MWGGQSWLQPPLRRLPGAMKYSRSRHFFFPPFVQTHSPALLDARRKIVADGQRLTRSASRLLVGGASSRSGLSPRVPRPPAMRTAPRRKRSTGWMARPTQTHLDTAKPPFWCPPFGGPPFRQNYEFEFKVSRGRNRRESITTVLRRSSAEEKTVGKSLGDIAL